MDDLKIIAVITAEVGITVLGAVALYMGIDGAIFVTVIGALAGLGGYQIRQSGQGTNGKSQ